MIDNSWIYILVCLAHCLSGTEGKELKSSKAYFTKDICEFEAKAIARNMYYPDKREYGYKCVKLDFEPKRLD